MLRGDPERDLGSWTPRIAVESYLGALPLIDGLTAGGHVRMVREVPGRMASKLLAGRIDAALLPTIELQRMDRPPMVLSAGCIGSDGATQAARIFSRVAPATIRTLHVDADSRTCVCLASILWAESFDRKLRIRTLDSITDLIGPQRPQAVLLIGDRVVTPVPAEYAWQVDMGEAWRELTGLPFVYAVWAMRSDPAAAPRMNQTRAATLCRVLIAARQRGMAGVEKIASVYGPKLGWDPAEAAGYLTERIQFKLTDEHRKGMETFLTLAHKHKLVQDLQPMTYVEG